ncbi:MAG: DUF2853 family protein [Flavobacteriales bacterium]|nr:DUF2853 family protein [Flavobacteriales bacterium]
MSKFDEAMDTYKGEMDKLGIKYDANLLQAVAKGLGPSIYNNDANKVSCSQESELETVKKNFLVGKLGLSESDDLAGACSKVCEQMGSSNRNKYRAIFYYLLVKHYKKENVYASAS